MTTLATPYNMRRFRNENPTRGHCLAYSPVTGEESSADDGDYWYLDDNTPLRDSEGEPMMLVVIQTLYLDALTGEKL